MSLFLWATLFSPTHAATAISGDITTDTLWTKVGSPYLIEHNLNISSGAVLTIEPGVIVKLAPVTLQVRGSILARGTATDPISFTALSDDSLSGDSDANGSTTPDVENSWYIEFYKGGSEFDYFNASYASSAFNVANGTTTLRHGTITHVGTALSTEASNAGLLVDRVTVSDSQNGAGSFEAGYVDIRNSLFEKGDYPYAYGLVFGPNGRGVIATSTVRGFREAGVRVDMEFGVSGEVVMTNVVLTENEVGATIVNYVMEVKHPSWLARLWDFIVPRAWAQESVIPIKIHNSAIFGNYQKGLDMESVYDDFIGIDARNNWWGHVDGPSTDENPNRGDDVTDSRILYEPWLSADPTSPPEPESPPVADCCNSVAFIPGFEASRLYTNTGGEEKELWVPWRNSYVEQLYLDSDGQSLDPNIYTRDIISESFGFNIYKSFIKSMDDLVTEDTRVASWEALPYDWRFSPEQVVTSGLKRPDGNISYIDPLPPDREPFMIEELERLASESKTGKVTIITHSNGGLVAKALIKHLEYLKSLGESDLVDHIDQVIMVAAPQIGTPKAIAGLLHGTDQGLGLGFLLNEETAREFGKNSPATYSLLPSSKYFSRVEQSPILFNSNLSGLTGNNFLPTYGAQVDSWEELKSFLSGADGRAQPATDDLYNPSILNPLLLQQAQNEHDSLDNWIFPEHIKVTQVVGWGLETIAGVEYVKGQVSSSQTTGLPQPNTPLDMRPKFTAEGDKTVVYPSVSLLSSANATSYYLNLDKYDTISRLSRDHADIFETQPILELINNLLTKENAVPGEILSAKPEISDEAKKIRVSVHSPVSLDLYDFQGNHTGWIPNPNPNSDLTLYEERIPNSYYLPFGEGVYAGTEENGTTTIKLHGTGVGTFTLEVGELTGGVSTGLAVYKDLPVLPTTSAELSLTNLNNKSALTVDLDGDGKTDFSLEPGENFDPVAYLQVMKGVVRTLGLPKLTEKILLLKIDRGIALIKKNKIKQLKIGIQWNLQRITNNKGIYRKIDNEDAQLIVEMLSRLLDNLK